MENILMDMNSWSSEQITPESWMLWNWKQRYTDGISINRENPATVTTANGDTCRRSIGDFFRISIRKRLLISLLVRA